MRIEKKNYSRKPWRLLTSEGKEVQAKVEFDHPDIGKTWILESISGDTKIECTEKAMQYLEYLFSKENSVVKNLLTRSRNLLSQPECWMKSNREARLKLAVEIETFLHPQQP